MKFLNAIDLNKNEILNVALQNLSGDPASPATGQIYFNTTDDVAKVYDGTQWIVVTDAWISDVVGTAPIQASVDGNGVATISIDAASQSDPGSMSAADKLKLDSATANNNASTIVFRDGSGNFSAGVITADLAGNAATADDADLLDGQDGTFYLSRANHTGTQLASTISNLKAVVTTYRLDEFATPNTNVSFGANRITNLADPVNDQDAATKAYVDAARQGLDAKQSVRVATTADITLSGTQTIDSVTLTVGDRVLVKNQTDASENGIYIVDNAGWIRAPDADSNAEVTSGMFTFVEEGNTNADSGWVLSTDGVITVGASNLTFVQFSGAGAIQAGAGLTKVGNTLNVGGTTDNITVNADSVQIATTYAGQTSITTLGTIATGVWEATPIGVAYGGTGATTPAGARSNLGATGKFTAAIGDGTATSYVLNHNFNSRDVTFLLRESSSPYAQVIPDLEMTTVNSVTVKFSQAPTSGQYQAVIVG